MELQWPLILFTFFLSLCGGTMAVQGLLTLMGVGKKMQNASLVVSAVSLVVGGVAVFMHLEHWERIFNAFGSLLAGNGTAVSGITLELWFCVLFALMLVLYFLFMRRSEDGMAPKWCAVLAIVIGLALPAATGDSYLMPSIPAWNTPLLIVYYVCNAVLLGGLVATVIAFTSKDTAAYATTAKVALAGGVVTLIVVVAYAAVINSFGQFGTIDYYFDPVHPDTPMVDSAAVNASILTGSQAAPFWGLAVVVGLVAPIALAFIAQRGDKPRDLPLAGTALACAVVGSFAWRCILYVVAISIFALF